MEHIIKAMTSSRPAMARPVLMAASSDQRGQNIMLHIVLADGDLITCTPSREGNYWQRMGNVAEAYEGRKK